MLKSSKGNISIDLLIILIVTITVLSIVTIIGYSILLQMETPLTNAGFNMTSFEDTKDAFKVFNTGIPFIFFSFIVISILLAVYLKTSPVISIFMIMVIAALGYVAEGMANAFHIFAVNPTMQTAANEFGYVVYMQNYLPYLILIAGVILIIFMFAKPKQLSV